MNNTAHAPMLRVKFRSYNGRANRIKAIIFTISIALIFAYSTFTVYTQSGPLILGTEMNSNGQVEYMCIGRSCEDIGARFSWKDQ